MREELAQAPTIWADEASVAEGHGADSAGPGPGLRALERYFAGWVLHDVSNVIAASLYQVHVTLARARSGHPCTDEVERLQVVLHAAAVMTRGFGHIARHDDAAGSTDLPARVRAILALLEAIARPRASLVVDIPEAVPRLAIAPGLLDRVLLNLVVNSVEAVDTGGEIEISARHVAKRPVLGSSSRSTDASQCVALVVADDGRGMPAMTAARAFCDGYSTKAAGRGVGLAVVASVVAATGGRVGIRSLDGVGTAVELRLPVVER